MKHIDKYFTFQFFNIAFLQFIYSGKVLINSSQNTVYFTVYVASTFFYSYCNVSCLLMSNLNCSMYLLSGLEKIYYFSAGESSQIFGQPMEVCLIVAREFLQAFYFFTVTGNLSAILDPIWIQSPRTVKDGEMNAEYQPQSVQFTPFVCVYTLRVLNIISENTQLRFIWVLTFSIILLVM